MRVVGQVGWSKFSALKADSGEWVVPPFHSITLVEFFIQRQPSIEIVQGMID